MARRRKRPASEEWKVTLEPWARLYAVAYRAMNRHLAKSSDEQLAKLAEAVRMPGQTNCGWNTYRVAQLMKSEITYELRVRRERREAAGPWRDRHGDVWQIGEDGLMHTPETIPFSREYVEKKWGPLVSVLDEETDRG